MGWSSALQYHNRLHQGIRLDALPTLLYHRSIPHSDVCRHVRRRRLQLRQHCRQLRPRLRQQRGLRPALQSVHHIRGLQRGDGLYHLVTTVLAAASHEGSLCSQGWHRTCIDGWWVVSSG